MKAKNLKKINDKSINVFNQEKIVCQIRYVQSYLKVPTESYHFGVIYRILFHGYTNEDINM